MDKKNNAKEMKNKNMKKEFDVDIISSDSNSVIYKFEYENKSYIFRARRRGKEVGLVQVYPEVPKRDDEFMEIAKAIGVEALEKLGLLKKNIGVKVFTWFIFILALIYIIYLILSGKGAEINGFWNEAFFIALPLYALLETRQKIGRLYKK